MSFSFTVKEEIVQSISNNDKGKACLYGMLMFCHTFSFEEILFQTENEIVSNTFTKLVSKALKNENAVSKVIKKKEK